jgi:hypothetical protein
MNAHLQSIGEDTILDLPIKFHKHYNKLVAQGKRLNSYILTDKYVQFSFEIVTGEKKKRRKCHRHRYRDQSPCFFK